MRWLPLLGWDHPADMFFHPIKHKEAKMYHKFVISQK